MNIDLKRTIPLFSDSVLVANIIKNKPIDNFQKKGNKDTKKEIQKEGFVTLIFVDSLSQQAISRIVLPKTTAENLEKALRSNLENFGKEEKTPILKKELKDINEPNKNKYFG